MLRRRSGGLRYIVVAPLALANSPRHADFWIAQLIPECLSGKGSDPDPVSFNGRTRDFESLNRGSNPRTGTDETEPDDR